MPQLDGLRALAVFAVVLHHFVPGGMGGAANLGVKLFFVLSGFLITSILIRSRNAAEASGRKAITALRNFYARRFLRIFPLYYMVIAVAILFSVDAAVDNSLYLLTYTLNIKMAIQGWYVAHFAHFWTLSVEEQFYLGWPWIVLLTPRSRLIYAVMGMVAIGPLCRLYLVLGWKYFGLQTSGLSAYISTLSCLDTLGMGALLAVFVHSDMDQDRLSGRIMRIWATVGLAILVVGQASSFVSYWTIKTILSDLGLGLVFGWLVYRASRGFGGNWGRFLSARPIRYLGRISYGVYVYHPLIPGIMAYFLGMIGVRFELGSALGIVTALVLTLVVSSVSWHAVEKPLTDMKRRFPA